MFPHMVFFWISYDLDLKSNGELKIIKNELLSTLDDKHALNLHLFLDIQNNLSILYCHACKLVNIRLKLNCRNLCLS